jgi:hypothetical protein
MGVQDAIALTLVAGSVALVFRSFLHRVRKRDGCERCGIRPRVEPACTSCCSMTGGSDHGARGPVGQPQRKTAYSHAGNVT